MIQFSETDLHGDGIMMGVQSAPEQLFYDFSLEYHVPGDHLQRQINRFLNFDELRSELKPFCSPIGRPSVDPRTDDPDAHCRLLFRHSLETASLRGGSSQFGLSLVLRSWAGG